MLSLEYKKLEKKLKIRFKRRTLLRTALTHSSFPEDPDTSNEVLEFLGDAVLELVTREHLLGTCPKAREGELSERKKNYTSTEALFRTGKRLGIGQFILMSKGEVATGGRHRPSIIAGTLEALIGALYIDRGLEYVRKFIIRIILQRKRFTNKDYKSKLNRWAMQHHKKITYQTTKESGPPHKRIFLMNLYIGKTKKASGTGNSKKDAEQNAAKTFLKKTANRKNANR